MVELRGILTGPVFGIDSKMIYKEWYNSIGNRREFRCLIGVSVNPIENSTFDESYDEIIGRLFDLFSIKRERRVYSASSIALLFQDRMDDFFHFCLAFSREILNLEDVKFSFFITRLNSKWLQEGKVTIYGEYGTATQRVSVPEFIDKIYPSYNVICGWKLSQITNLRNGLFLLDGIQDTQPSYAWEQFCKDQYLRIVFRGDQTIPVISTSDIIIRYLESFILQRRGMVDEKALEDIVFYDDKVIRENKYFIYVGNPDIGNIKPLSERKVNVSPYVQHPIIYIGAGSIIGQSSIIEDSPLYDRILDYASNLYASIKIYDPRKDRVFIGRGEITDYFIPITEVAEGQFQALSGAGLNIEKINI